jgi:hypothetical protein
MPLSWFLLRRGISFKEITVQFGSELKRESRNGSLLQGILGFMAISSMSGLVALSLPLVESLGTFNPYLRCDLDSSFSSTLPLDNRRDPF